MGLSVLAFNFTMEYVALKGETPLTELPSFQSMLKRTGLDSEFNATYAARVSWRPVLEGQFRSILRMFIPYSLLGRLDHHGAADGSPTWLSKGLAVVLGIALSVASLIGLILVRPRILFATLASFGFFWALLMRNATSIHPFESIYYIGLPLVCFTIILLLARRLTNRDGVIAAAAVASLLLFAASSFQMSRVGHSAEAAQAARAAVQELTTIRKTTAGEPVTVLNARTSTVQSFAWSRAAYAMDYYLNSHPIDYAYLKGRFVVMRERLDTDALLTPQNQYFFLYDGDGLKVWYGDTYRSVASTEPLARKEFDVYFDDRTMYYLKEPCERADTAFTDIRSFPHVYPTTDIRFFLHVYPIDENDLPVHRRQYGFDNLDFSFVERGLLFDGKCLARFALPQYAVSKIVTGRLYRAWSAVHYIHPPPELISEYQSIVSNEPVARSEFDVYVDGGTLHYVKDPCVRADTAARFFLHVVPEDENDLPDVRKQHGHGFDNLDFDFAGRGVLFGGKCMVNVDLPRYDIARIVTGQFDGGGRIWEVGFSPDALE